MTVNENRFPWRWSVFVVESFPDPNTPVQIPDDVSAVFVAANGPGAVSLPKNPKDGQILVVLNGSFSDLKVVHPSGGSPMYVPLSCQQTYIYVYVPSWSMGMWWEMDQSIAPQGAYDSLSRPSRAKYFKVSADFVLTNYVPYPSDNAEIVVKNTGASPIIISGGSNPSGFTFDGNTTYSLAAGATVTLVSNDSINWEVFPW